MKTAACTLQLNNTMNASCQYLNCGCQRCLCCQQTPSQCTPACTSSPEDLLLVHTCVGILKDYTKSLGMLHTAQRLAGARNVL